VRILHAITTLDVGGAEMHVLAQVRGQTRRGHAVRVVYLKGGGALADEVRSAGAEVAERVGPLGLARHARWAEIVHSHLLKADALAAVVATLAGRRSGLVASKHNDEQVLRRPLVSLLHGALGRLPRRTIVLSDHVGRFVAEHGRVPLARQARIYYGLDPEPFARAIARGPAARLALRASLGLAPEDVVFTCVARFAPQKAHAVLLEGFARARKLPGGERLRLLLVGDDPFGPGRQRAEELARSLGLGERVVFAGIRRDVPELLAASDALVMSSLWEGLGLVFLEAMAARLAVLATDVSAIPEVVADGETGLLVGPGDAAALAEAMARLARDPALRERLGAAGQARVRKIFALDRMVEETLAVYRELPAARGR
jgi:glycosyltransferase involved in cell wall biosynthesis